MKYIKGIDNIINFYDLFIVDLWGVVFDGENLYPGVKKLLRVLKEKRKKVIFLSNSSLGSQVIRERVLNSWGIGSQYFDYVITAGEVCVQYLKNNYDFISKNTGNSFSIIGKKIGLDILTRYGYNYVEDLNETNFAFITSYQDMSEGGIHENDMQIFDILKGYKISLFCTNPDKKIINGYVDGKRIFRAGPGMIADKYRSIGGKVMYFGKPYKVAYDYTMHVIRDILSIKINKDKIIAIGDTIDTDIIGANNYGIDSCLVLSGNTTQESLKLIKNRLHKPKIVTDGFML